MDVVMFFSLLLKALFSESWVAHLIRPTLIGKKDLSAWLHLES